LVGVVASFTLVNAFALERVLFICCFAAWLSICAYFSHYQRGQWAYAWVLSGYTTAIVGIPAALAPDQAFTIIASRAENIIIGILCMGAVSMIVFPETVSRSLVKLVPVGDERFFLRFRGTAHEMQLWLERYNTVRIEENASWSSLRWRRLAAR
jgi:uncharacterized membrane protein YccC